MRGPLQLLTVPPYFARSPKEALLPIDLLEQVIQPIPSNPAKQ
jgi:hypothetical protein